MFLAVSQKWLDETNWFFACWHEAKSCYDDFYDDFVDFMSPRTLKNLTSLPRQTKSPDNSNMLHIFNNNTYTDFLLWSMFYLQTRVNS